MSFQLNGVQRLHKRMTGFCAARMERRVAEAPSIAHFRSFSQAAQRRIRIRTRERNVENSSESLPDKESDRPLARTKPPTLKRWRLQHSLKCPSPYGVLRASRLSPSAAVLRNPSKAREDGPTWRWAPVARPPN